MDEPEMDCAAGYLAMYAFLDLLCERKDEGLNDLAVMLSGISLLGDGVPRDQGYIQDWEEALTQATGRRSDSFTPAEIYQAMPVVLRTEANRGADDGFKRMIIRLTQPPCRPIAVPQILRSGRTGSPVWSEPGPMEWIYG